MIRVQNAVTIQRQPKDVAPFLADVANEPRWWEGVRSVQLVSGEAGQTGARYERRFVVRGKERSTLIDVVERADNQRIVIKSAPGPVQVTGTVLIQPIADGSQVNLTIDAKTRGLAWLMSRSIRKTMAQNTATSLQRLKALLESEKPAAPAKAAGGAKARPASKKAAAKKTSKKK